MTFHKDKWTQKGAHSLSTCSEEGVFLFADQSPKVTSPWPWFQLNVILHINNLHVNTTQQSKYLLKSGGQLFHVHGQKRVWNKSNDILHDVQLTETPCELRCHFVLRCTVLSGWKAFLFLMACNIFSRLGKCVSLPFLRCMVQTSSLALNALTALIMCGRCLSFPCNSVLSAFSFAVRSIKQQRFRSHAPSDSSLCSSSLNVKKVLISGSKSTNLCNTLPRLNHRTSVWRSKSPCSASSSFSTASKVQCWSTFALIEFISLTISVITWEKSKTLLTKACWWIIQW